MELPVDFCKISSCIVSLLVGHRQLDSLPGRVPYVSFCDLFQIYAILQGNSFIIIRNEYLDMWQTNQEIVHRLAQTNSLMLLGQTFQPLHSAIPSARLTPDTLCRPELYLLTNPLHTYGASAALYPGVLKAIYKRLRSDFYLLPASIHELIIVPDREIIEPEDLLRVLHENNRFLLPSAEYLSDSLYCYHHTTDKVTCWHNGSPM